jgi:uncharacterized delta-60 repeat protein
VAKYKVGPNGATQVLWKKQLGTSDDDSSYGVATDSQGNVFISGATGGALAGSNKGDSDAWVAKYSPEGTLLWTKQLGTSEYDSSWGVATDSQGNVFISGATGGALAGSNKGYRDAWVAKYSPEGTLLWTKQLGSSEYDSSWGVATDSQGNVFISGDTTGALAGSNKGDSDAWVAKYSPEGTLLWKKQLGSSNLERSLGVAIGSQGNILISGVTADSLGGEIEGYFKAWVAKYSPKGTLLWKKQLDSLGFDSSSLGVATDSQGNVFISGVTEGALAGSNKGFYDAWVAKYSPKGTLLWKKQLGTLDVDISYGVATDSGGNVFTAGYTGGALKGSNRGRYDAWVAKYSPNGKLWWLRQEGTRTYDYAYNVATDNNGHVLVTGFTEGNLGD